MFDLLLNKTFVVEKYEIKIVNKQEIKGFNVEQRWKVKFSDIPIASGFLSQSEAEKYICKNGHLALWNALWVRGFQISWDSQLEVKINVDLFTKEM